MEDGTLILQSAKVSVIIIIILIEAFADLMEALTCCFIYNLWNDVLDTFFITKKGITSAYRSTVQRRINSCATIQVVIKRM